MTAGVALVAVVVAVAASAVLLWGDRGRAGGALEMGALVVVLPFAAALATAPVAPAAAALLLALAVAALARERRDPVPSECALKMAWVLGPSLALSAAGLALLRIATATGSGPEQWSVLAVTAEYGMEPGYLWAAGLPLSLLAGVVLLGGAPFHFWLIDLLHGAPPWISPLAAAALQLAGVGWLSQQLRGIEGYPPADRLADTLLSSAAGVALAIGGLTLQFQRHPERRIGTLASLQGALVLASLAMAESPSLVHSGAAIDVAAWSAHLVVALTGATVTARFLRVQDAWRAPAPVLVRRHPLIASCGLYAIASLAGVPGTPGAALWLAVARAAAAADRAALLAAVALAWVSALFVAVRLVREAFGIAGEEDPPAGDVPWEPQVGMALAGVALVAGMAWGLR
jgi:NADH:ubiquinone oxidoreductase subunit 2 (subunit N)